MWSVPVVIAAPHRQRDSGCGQRGEERFIEMLIAQTPVERFNKTVLHGFAWRDIVPFNSCIVGPFENGIARELTARRIAVTRSVPDRYCH